MSRIVERKRVFIFVNGILSRPGSHDGWTDRATTWVNAYTPHKAEKWEYATGPLLRRLRQQTRAEKIATLMWFYEAMGFDIVLVGHSNGCDIIARVLALRGQELWYYGRQVAAAHLYAAAADAADFDRAIEAGDIRIIHLHCSGQDKALAFGRWTRRVAGWAGLGYGSLGIEPETLHERSRIFVHEYPDYGHSTFWEKGERFNQTMQNLMYWDRSALKTSNKISDP